MGALADTAKKNSNFFKIERGESLIVKYLDYRIVPSTMDPTKDSVQYRFSTEHGDKFWTNGNGSIMLFFDTLTKGSMVRITRNPWINKDKTEDKSKSTYVVEEVKTEINVLSISMPPLSAKPGTPVIMTNNITGKLVVNPDDIVWKD